MTETGVPARRDAWKVVLTIMAVITLGNLVLYLVLPQAISRSMIGEVTRSNLQIAEQVRITRNYYAEQVVAKARASGAMHPTWDHEADPLGIPLPATFVKDLSALLAAKETTLRLVSPWPWPHRRDRVMDAFETRAWAEISANPDAVVTEFSESGGRNVLKIAVADRLTSQACVDCHNADPKSPRADWKLGDVRAVLAVTKTVDAAFADGLRQGRMMVAVIALAAYGLGGLASALYLLAARRQKDKAVADARIRRMAFQDSLTGLPNRKSFFDRLNQGLATAAAGRQAALFFMDVDGFKSINDIHGHDAGDAVLAEVGARLRARMAETILLGRVGGDEFVLAATDLGGEDEARAIAAEIVALMQGPITAGGRVLTATASVGVAVEAAASASVARLMEHADIALYEAKKCGRNRAALYDALLREQHHRLRRIEARVRWAAENNGFSLHFQPICKARSLDLWGFEALARLSFEEDGTAIPPSEFIRVAETLGLIPQIGAWIIGEALRQAARWPDHLIVSVNLSALQFQTGAQFGVDLLSVTRQALAESGIPAWRLEFEVTESLYLHASANVLGQLRELNAMGVKIALDDFGTGYATLAYLWKFPFSKMKIDSSFVTAIKDLNTSANTVIAATVTLAHALGMAVTAEGVEDARQVEFLKLLGCDLLQGYLFGRPMSADDAVAMLEERRRPPGQASA